MANIDRYEKGQVFVAKQLRRYKQGNVPVIALPHSCDSWVIGTDEDAEVLIADLREAIAKYREQRFDKDNADF